jgi:hypothetical protein
VSWRLKFGTCVSDEENDALIRLPSAQHQSRTPHPQQQPPVKKRRSPGSPAGNAAAMLGVGEIEEQKPMVSLCREY